VESVSCERKRVARRAPVAIRTRFLAPALVGSSGGQWSAATPLREERYCTKGRVIVRGETVKRGEATKADDIQYLMPGLSIAVIEAKDDTHAPGWCRRRSAPRSSISHSRTAATVMCNPLLDRTFTGPARERP
jgi:type I site-specific restriction endonuclease